MSIRAVPSSLGTPWSPAGSSGFPTAGSRWSSPGSSSHYSSPRSAVQTSTQCPTDTFDPRGSWLVPWPAIWCGSTSSRWSVGAAISTASCPTHQRLSLIPSESCPVLGCRSYSLNCFESLPTSTQGSCLPGSGL